MNLELLNPFTTSFPENFDSSVDVAGLCARFNPRGLFAGHYLAVGRLDGVVIVLDFETKCIVRWLEGHVKAVTTVCWSSNSRYLLTASRDWNAIIWDLSASAADTVEGERRHTVRFDAPITSADLHPRNSKMLVVTLHGQTQPVFVDLREGGGRWELEPPPDEEEVQEEEDDEDMEIIREVATFARFNPRGDLIYVGTSRGNIHIWDVYTKEWLWTEYIGVPAPVKQLAFNKTGSSIILNSNDRCIRLIALSPDPPEPPSDEEEAAEFELPPPRPLRIPYFEVVHRFQDLVNRTPWNGCGFSSDGEYIIGGAGHKAAHNIYIWDRETGTLVKILEGPKDPCEDLDWHPSRPLIASVSSLGMIHTWVTPIVENWSAYAPGFEELDENREYEEREDEFDFEDETAIRRRAADLQDHPVDILSHTTPSTRAAIVEPWPEDYDGVDAYEDYVIRDAEDDDAKGQAFYPAPILLDEADLVALEPASPEASGRRR
ncbi:chromatin binding protein [Rhodotorula toruloides]